MKLTLINEERICNEIDIILSLLQIEAKCIKITDHHIHICCLLPFSDILFANNHIVKNMRLIQDSLLPYGTLKSITIDDAAPLFEQLTIYRQGTFAP